MLLCQQGCRHQDGDLLTTLHGHESGPQCDLCLAETDITTHHAVHGLRGDHVLDNGLDGRLLVMGFLERETGAEFSVHGLVELESVTLARLPACVQVEQFCRDVANLLDGAALGFSPLVTAQAMQRRIFGRRAGVP